MPPVLFGPVPQQKIYYYADFVGFRLAGKNKPVFSSLCTCVKKSYFEEENVVR